MQGQMSNFFNLGICLLKNHDKAHFFFTCQMLKISITLTKHNPENISQLLVETDPFIPFLDVPSTVSQELHQPKPFSTQDFISRILLIHTYT